MKPNPIFLDEMKIREHLAQAKFMSPLTIHRFDSLDSTNLYLKNLKEKKLPIIALTETQTAGRGRFNRQWASPYAENIYFSQKIKVNCNLEQLKGLSLVVGLALIDSLTPLKIENIKLKWPNDLIYKDKKLAGILIESNLNKDNIYELIIGIGLNVNSNTAIKPLSDKPHCSLYDIKEIQLDRNSLVANLIISLTNHLNQFLTLGLSHFFEKWQSVDYLQGKNIRLSQIGNKTSLEGEALGIDAEGQLIIKDKEGNLHHLSSAEVSLA